jgi:hypothetical protein
MAQLLASVVSDIMGALAIPGGSTLSMAIQEVFKKRLSAAREILLKEIRAGHKTLCDAQELEEVAAILYRYSRAAQEGAARQNLCLLAKVIHRQITLSSLNANDFLYYADIVCSLTQEEIQVLGIMMREKCECYYRPRHASLPISRYYNEDCMERIMQSLTRTGLVLAHYNVARYVGDDTEFAWPQYRLTPLMLEKIAPLIPFDEVGQEAEPLARSDTAPLG